MDRFLTWRHRFVRRVYADHNDSKWVSQALSEVLGTLKAGKKGLNIGSGSTRLHDQLINIDITQARNVNCIADAHRLPFRDEVFDVVVTQETLEHVADPFQTVREIARVLRMDGLLYCQVPFVLGYHPGPTDYWRFTCEGIQQLTDQAGLHCIKLGMATGPATALYRVLVEFTASSIGRMARFLYMPAKAASAMFFFPLKLLDPLLIDGFQANRVTGGYFVVALKSGRKDK